MRLAVGTLEDRVFCALTLKEGLLFVLVLRFGSGRSPYITGVRGVEGTTVERGEGGGRNISLFRLLRVNRFRIDVFGPEVFIETND